MRLGIAFIAILCCSGYAASAQVSGPAAMPHVLVYKAKKQYRHLVQVQLSDDKKKVVSYPDPSDIKTGSSATAGLPVSLHKGYWLDKRGIGLNTAFIDLTYEQFAKLKTPPSPDALYNMIVDKDPITELCDCGTRQKGKYSVKQLNELIDKKLLKKECKVLR